MTKQQIFPTILIVLDLCAAITYMCPMDKNKIIYWVSAAVLTFSVTYKI